MGLFSKKPEPWIKNLSPFPKWTRVLDAQPFTSFRDITYHADEVKFRVNATHAWAKKHIAYKSETKDFWQTPDETNSLKTGDCEDIAIYNMHVLIKSNYFPKNEVYLCLGYNNQNQFHCVTEALGWRIDNQLSEPLPVKKHNKVFTPVFYLSTFGWRRA